MRKRKKNRFITLLILLIVTLGLGYAFLTQELTINGTGNIKANTWDIHFESLVKNSGNVELSSGDVEASIDPTTRTSVIYTVTLKLPGDFYEFTVDAVNGGTIDGMIDSVSYKMNNVEISDTNPLPSFLNYSVTYKDGVKFGENHILKANSRETYKVRLEFRTDISSNQLPSADATYTFQFIVNYVQADENAKVRKVSVQPQTLYLYSDDILNLSDKSQKADVSMHFNDGTDTYYAKVKLQGTSSLNYPKKNYTITFYSDDTYTSKQKVDVNHGWGAQSKYCLKANWIDSTQARNIVSARLAAQMQDKYHLFTSSPNNGLIDGFFVEVYINDEYHGLYTMNIPKDAWMFDMSSKNPNHIIMAAENPLRNSATTFEQLSSTVNGVDWEIEAGPSDTEEEVQATFAKLNRLIAFVKDSTNAEFRAHASEYLNLDALLNYYSFMALSNAVDNMNKNMLMVTYDGLIWYPSLYDLDSTWGLCFDGSCTYSPTNRVTDYGGGSSLLFKKLVECFPEELQERYYELRSTVLSNANIISEFDKFFATVTQEQWDREHTKWPGIPGQQYDFNQIKSHLLERGNYIDSVMTTIYHAPASYADQRIIYKLDTPFVGGVNKFIDTGINLYKTNESDQHATIVLKYKVSDNHSNNSTTIFNNGTSSIDMNEKNGITMSTAFDGSDEYIIYWVGDHQYNATWRENPSQYQTVIITLNGNTYNIYHTSTSNGTNRTISSSTVETVNNNLILGGVYYDDGTSLTIHNMLEGEIEEFIVYDEVLSQSEINNLFTQYNS